MGCIVSTNVLVFVSRNSIYEWPKNIDLSTLISGNQTIVLNNVGTINYTTGAAIINLPAITAYNNKIALYADSVSHDFTVKNNTILLIDPADVNVSVTATA